MSYALFVEPEVHAARDSLPGHIRQRMRRAISGLAETPCPPGSRPLNVAGLDVPADVAVYRLRMERWRLIYAVHEPEQWVRVIGLYRRPPYDYGDLADLMEKLS